MRNKFSLRLEIAPDSSKKSQLVPDTSSSNGSR